MHPFGKIKYLHLLIWSMVAWLNISSAFSQTITFNKEILLDNRPIIFRNINIDQDSLLITGEIGTDSSGLQGIFILQMDTFGNMGMVKLFYDPEQIDQMLLNGSNPVIKNEDNTALSGEFIWKSDNYFITYNTKTGDTFYKEYSAPFLVRFTESLITYDKAFYVIGFIQTQNYDLDVFLQKIDSSGNKIWEKTYGVPSKDETGRAAIIEDDGLTIMVSESFDNTPTIKNDTRYWTQFIHIDTSGLVKWMWEEEVTGDEGYGGAFVKYGTDYIYTTNYLGDEYSAGILQASQLVRRDSAFNLVWRKVYGERDNFYNGFGDMIMSQDSNLLLTGAILDESEEFNWARVMKICPDGEVLCETRDTGYVLANG